MKPAQTDSETRALVEPVAGTVVTLESSGLIQRLTQAVRGRAPRPGETLAEQRADFEAAMAAMDAPDEFSRHQVSAGGVPAEWLDPVEKRGNRTLLYLHGGGYTMGSPATARRLAGTLGRRTGARVLNLDYRLGPEHPFPAAVEDAAAAYVWLLEIGVEAADIAIAGDSAGGGLTLTTLLAARDRGLPMPGGAFCISPWTDLTVSLAAAQPNASVDPMVTDWRLREMADHYLAGQDPRQPLASPAFADLTGLPPVLIHVGGAEVLLDDARVLAEAAERDGVPITLEIYPDMIHVWHSFFPRLTEAGDALDRAARWLGDRWSDPTPFATTSTTKDVA
jgi:monoterpene epsilon-lactone hydrolase